MLKTTQVPTESALLNVCATSWKLPHFAFLVILYQACNDTPQAECALLASRIFLRLITFTHDLRILRSQCQDKLRNLRSLELRQRPFRVFHCRGDRRPEQAKLLPVGRTELQWLFSLSSAEQ